VTLTPLTLRHQHAPVARARLALLDRDGVLVENRDGYVRSHADVAILPGGLQGLERLAEAGVAVVVVTNQACIAKSIISRDQAIAVHEHVLDRLGAAGRTIVATYICPHRDEQRCACRKPAPGLVQAALADHPVALADAFLVGDAASDIAAASASGIRSYAVRTGRIGEAELAQMAGATTLADDLDAAVAAEFARAGPLRG
jgi:D-glycero-D-manno-heptose 1,7-bisphosphate phosphatase